MRFQRTISRALLLLMVPLTPACSASPTYQDSKGMMRAGPGEPTFSERFSVAVKLPIPVANFELMLKSRHLAYETHERHEGDKVEATLPLPRRNPEISRDSLWGCIEVLGTHDRKKRSMEIFRAYINKAGEVFYIENAFAYTAT